MDSIYFEDPLGLLIELASYRFEPPHGLHARRRAARGAQAPGRSAATTTSTEGHLADAIEALVERSRESLSDDRSPKNPYRTVHPPT